MPDLRYGERAEFYLSFFPIIPPINPAIGGNLYFPARVILAEREDSIFCRRMPLFALAPGPQ